jgi:hypothetical protein
MTATAETFSRCFATSLSDRLDTMHNNGKSSQTDSDGRSPTPDFTPFVTVCKASKFVTDAIFSVPETSKPYTQMRTHTFRTRLDRKTSSRGYWQ